LRQGTHKTCDIAKDYMDRVEALKEDGFVVLRGAVSSEAMSEAADVIKSSALKTQEEQGEIWTEYELSPNLLNVVTKVVEVCL